MDFRAIIFLLCLGLTFAKVLNLSCSQIREFVDVHNKFRLQIAKGKVSGQPAASKMKLMVWDKELAAKARKWASHKNFNHNPDKSIRSDRFPTGENLYMYMTTANDHEVSIEDALKSWFDEHKDYNYGPLSNADFTGPDQIGHYTQMVWSESIRVGCGISKYKENGYFNFFIVCNYGPAGNYLGSAPYTSGKPSNELICGENDCDLKYGERC